MSKLSFYVVSSNQAILDFKKTAVISMDDVIMGLKMVCWFDRKRVLCDLLSIWEPCHRIFDCLAGVCVGGWL